MPRKEDVLNFIQLIPDSKNVPATQIVKALALEVLTKGLERPPAAWEVASLIRTAKRFIAEDQISVICDEQKARQTGGGNRIVRKPETFESVPRQSLGTRRTWFPTLNLQRLNLKPLKHSSNRE
ncbi:hypothetical protein [Planctomicrobium piriforme]|uniref:Uncharacterized protein n=1 Tax=Planctomicrobium piriforme TaxID=1576369 RepID=A0A1I3THP7_9PLAN|nr:hypothetical protein [Planctomicrobium piriforme]SFJ69959.1 hypothetical protein SAMN05421753_13018 [Planctomicrobium piriforme]